MTEKILALFYFFRNRRILFFLSVGCVAVICSFFASKIRLEEDITRFLPRDENTNRLHFALDNLKIKDKLIITVFQQDSMAMANPEKLAEVADQLVDSLKKKFEPEFIHDVTYKVSDDLISNLYTFFYHHLPVYLDEQDYATIEAKLTPSEINQALKSAYQNLLSPSGIVLSKFIAQDPLNISSLALQKMQRLQFDENFEMQNGYLFTKDKKHLLIFVTPAFSSREAGKNEKFVHELKQVVSYFSSPDKNTIGVEAYGAAIVSTDNAIRIKKDTLTTTIIALVLILFVLFFFFKRKRTILFILFPVIFGAVLSVCMLYFLKREVSAIALGAGSIILGIAINYSLHFFTHYKHKGSVERVIRDISLPMLLGCTTTVLAFMSLVFVKSTALHDFGLFVGFSLIGAVLFSILVLPHLPGDPEKREPGQEEKNTSWLDKIASYRLDKNHFWVIGTLALTIFFSYKAGDVQFDHDMMKMNYQSPETKLAEEHLNRMNEYTLHSVYLVARGKNTDEALRRTELNVNRLEKLKANGVIKKYSTITPVMVSDSLQRKRIERWNNFWKDKKEFVRKELTEQGKEFKFKEDAFKPFYELLDKNFTVVSPSEFEPIKKATVHDWINETKDYTTVITMLKIDDRQKSTVYETFKDDPSTIVFDRQTMTSQFVSMIRSDFNLILLMASLIVFGFMLLSYGRIELAVINFLPMLISWLWILGIMALVGIQFNIINIIISTFIFGLGDDYSIFIMNGLNHEYKSGNKNLESFKTSIFLSAIITTIGIGVLIFAKHPALFSIAFVTILGMIAVVLVSFVAEPLFYNFLILDRAKKKKEPYTFFNLILTTAGFALLCAGCFLLTLFGFLVYLLPVPMEKRKLIFHTAMMFFCRIILNIFIHVKKTILNDPGENFTRPAVIICNHQSYVDLGLILQLNPKIISIANDRVWNSFLFSRIVRMADFYPASMGLDKEIQKFHQAIARGYSILIFPEGTRSIDRSILRFHKGAFLLAETLNVDLLPMLIHGTGDCVPKHDFHLNKASMTLKILPRIAPGDDRFGNNYSERAKSVRRYFIQEYEKLSREVETPYFFREKLRKNYIYKKPYIEYQLKKDLKINDYYNLYHELIPLKGTIVELDCGAGFLSYMLALVSKERNIIAIDKDDEKIQMANNAILKTDSINFICSDYDLQSIQSADAIIIRKELSLEKPERILSIIEECYRKLNMDGIILADSALTGFVERVFETNKELAIERVYLKNKKNFLVVLRKNRM